MNEKLEGLYPAHVETMKKRHDRALEAAGYDHVLIYGGGQHMAFLDDNAYPFRVNPHFKSWVPVLDNPNCFVLYTPGTKPTLIFYQPVDFWHKPAESPKGYWVEHFDIKTIANPEDAKSLLPAGQKTAFIGEWDSPFGAWGLSDPNPPAILEPLHFDRAWKTEYEIECMRIANVIGARGHRAAEEAFRLGASEYEIHLAYLRATGHTEGQLPYGNIIALNEHGAVLHYQHQERNRPAAVHSFLIDAGATQHGYASDITRTYSANNGEFQAVIDAVEKMQLELCDAVKPGVDYKSLQTLTHRHVAKILSDFHFVDSADAAFEKGITRAFFPHGLGHYIGLQVHDVGGFSADASGNTIPKPEGQPFLRLTRVVEKSHVFTIEPGIYIIDSLLAEVKKGAESKHVDWKTVDRFRKYGGVRIEDDVVVTDGSHENLTRDAFAKV